MSEELESDHLLFSKLEKVIHPNEQLIWMNKPKRIPFILSAGNFPVIIFGLIWTMLCWWGGLKLFGLVGFFFIYFGLNDYLARLIGFHETVFGLTKNRILIRTGTFGGVNVQTIELESVSDVVVNVSLLERIFNVGTVKFFIGKTAEDGDGKTYNVYHCWLAIENPFEIYEAVNKAIFERKNLNDKSSKKKKKNLHKKRGGYKLDY